MVYILFAHASELTQLLLAADLMPVSVPIRVPLPVPLPAGPMTVRSAVTGPVMPETVMLQSLAQPMMISSGLPASSPAAAPCSEYGFSTGRMGEWYGCASLFLPTPSSFSRNKSQVLQSLRVLQSPLELKRVKKWGQYLKAFENCCAHTDL